MESIFDLLLKRRSVRAFTNEPVGAEKIEKILRAGQLSPSSRNKKPWHFVVVSEKARLTRLALAKKQGSSFLQDAKLAIVVCGNTNISDVWVEDCAIAALVLHLEAAELGLGSCWVQLRLREHDDKTSASDYVAALLDLPKHIEPLAIMAIGWPAEIKAAHLTGEPLLPCISAEHYGRGWAAPEGDYGQKKQTLKQAQS